MVSRCGMRPHQATYLAMLDPHMLWNGTQQAVRDLGAEHHTGEQFTSYLRVAQEWQTVALVVALGLDAFPWDLRNW